MTAKKTPAAPASRRPGRPLADDPTLAIGLRLPRSMVAEVDSMRGERTRQDVFREAVASWLKRERRRRA